MEEFIEKLMNVNEPKTLFLLCGIFIFTDVITGYLKAFKHKTEYNIDSITGLTRLVTNAKKQTTNYS